MSVPSLATYTNTKPHTHNMTLTGMSHSNVFGVQRETVHRVA